IHSRTTSRGFLSNGQGRLFDPQTIRRKASQPIRRRNFCNDSGNRYLVWSSKSRKLQIQKEARTALLGDIVDFPISEMSDVFGK
ncbi:MAG: hypothetical protein LC776_06890, partial [Acidobacteria bacterium]|nr:hypothetical protein [Acidobacteriota bacterium]